MDELAKLPVSVIEAQLREQARREDKVFRGSDAKVTFALNEQAELEPILATGHLKVDRPFNPFAGHIDVFFINDFVEVAVEQFERPVHSDDYVGGPQPQIYHGISMTHHAVEDLTDDGDIAQVDITRFEKIDITRFSGRKGLCLSLVPMTGADLFKDPDFQRVAWDRGYTVDTPTLIRAQIQLGRRSKHGRRQIEPKGDPRLDVWRPGAAEKLATRLTVAEGRKSTGTTTP